LARVLLLERARTTKVENKNKIGEEKNEKLEKFICDDYFDGGFDD